MSLPRLGTGDELSNCRERQKGLYMEKVSQAVSSNVRASFQGLAKTARNLNFTSDALGKYVSEIEEALKSLNLGVSAWVTISKSTRMDGMATWNEELGYDKIGKNWCIGLRSYQQTEWDEEYIDFERWTFNEGPREVRIRAIDRLPDLIRELDSEASRITKRIADKLPVACDLATEIRVIPETRTDGGNKR